MKRLSLSDLKAKQAELAKKIAAAEEKEKSLIGAYMQELTGECDLDGVKSWLEEHAIIAELRLAFSCGRPLRGDGLRTAERPGKSVQPDFSL